MELITKDEAAELMSVTTRQIDRHVKKSRLDVKKQRDEDGVTRNYYLKEQVLDLRDSLRQTHHQPAAAPLTPVGPSVTPMTPSLVESGPMESIAMALSNFVVKQRTPLSEKLVLTVEEAEEYSGASGHSIKRAIKAGELPSVTGLGRGHRIKRVELEAWIENV